MKTLFLVRIVLGVVLLSSCVGKNRRREKGSWSHQQIGNFSSTAVFAFEDVNETYEDVNRTKRHYNQHRQHAGITKCLILILTMNDSDSDWCLNNLTIPQKTSNSLYITTLKNLTIKY